jgi:two-component system, chemotaxis family, sensor kinase CheA
MTEIRREIEEISLQMVMGLDDVSNSAQSAEAVMASLSKVREAAGRECATGVAEAADSLIQALSQSADSAELQEAMRRLQEAAESSSARTSEPPSLAQDPELLRDFVLESGEHLSNIEGQLLVLEREPGDAEALNSVFRGFHTIKGLAGFLELWDVQKAAHEVETALDAARNGQITIDGAAIDVILQSSDYLRGWLNYLESVLEKKPGSPPAFDDPLLARIKELSEGSGAPKHVEAGLTNLAAAVEPSPVEAAPANSGAARHAELSVVKVDTAKLDFLVDMAGEMVIAQAMVHHDPSLDLTKNPRLQKNLAQLSRITGELHKTAMSMRLVPMGPLFRRMARLVRDLARQFGKQVVMQTEGDEIELDRHIVEELADPLMHMVRNSLDHGIETPEERVRAGKGPAGTLTLRGRHHAGQVVIEIADDGRGLNREKIIAKAIDSGLIASGDAMSDSDVFGLIFRPGFSTAAQVTNVSGRGVGMDVVRRHIEKLRGRIEVQSTAGQGSTFLLKLPLTLAIIDGLVVGVGRERYIVPLFGVREVLRPGPDTIWTIKQRTETAMIRDEILPVLRLYRRFRVSPRSEDPSNSVLLVTEVEGCRFCILVDEVIGKQEVVIKALGDTFKHVPGVAGGAILGDGRIGLILDLERLYRDGCEDARD